jgi:hypothetical protein
MKKVLLAVIMVLCFSASAFAFFPMQETSVFMANDQRMCGPYMSQASIISAQTNTGSFICAKQGQAQGYVNYDSFKLRSCHTSVSTTSFSAAGQAQYQNLMIIQNGRY